MNLHQTQNQPITTHAPQLLPSNIHQSRWDTYTMPAGMTNIPNSHWKREDWIKNFYTVLGGVPEKLSSFLEQPAWKHFSSHLTTDELVCFKKCFPELSVEKLSNKRDANGRYFCSITKMTPAEMAVISKAKNASHAAHAV